MPIDLFIGKSSVQTNIYVFRVGEAHRKDDIVKFIDFSNDGYTRTNRRKASCNLRDTDRAKERYQELADLVRFGKSKLNIFTEKEYYESTVDPENGADWNQSAPIDTKPTLEDFKKTVSDYLTWEVSNVLIHQNIKQLNKTDNSLNEKLKNIEWGKYTLDDLFESSSGNFDIQKTHINGKGEYVITAGQSNNGILGKSDIPAKIFDKNTLTIDMFGFVYYRQFSYKMVTHARVFSLKPKFSISERQGIFLVNCLQFLHQKFGYENMCSWEKIKSEKIQLPVKNGKIDFDFMESFITEQQTEQVTKLLAYLKTIKLNNY